MRLPNMMTAAALAALALGTLGGCVSYDPDCCVAGVEPVHTQAMPQPVVQETPLCGGPGCVRTGTPRATVAAPNKIQAVGYGATGNYGLMTAAQARLMAMRAAKLDAYRTLAEQVYGIRVNGSTAVSAFATQSDSVRSYVDTFIRGARVVQVVALADGTYEATVELDLPVTFIECIRVGVRRGCGAPGGATSG